MYDRLITIQRKTTERNAVGTPKNTWAFLKSKFTHVQYQRGNTTGGDHGEQTTTDAVFTIRWDPDIDYNCRVMFENKRYRIRHIEHVGRMEKMRLLTLMTESDDN